MQEHYFKHLMMGFVCVVLGAGLTGSTRGADTPAAPPMDFAAWVERGRPKAIEHVLNAFEAEADATRAHALEAAQALPERAVGLAKRGLDDKSPVVRFVAAVTIGKLAARELAPSVRERMGAEQGEIAQLQKRIADERGRITEAQVHRMEHELSARRSAWAAELFALNRCGQDVDLSPMASLLTLEDAYLRGNVVMLLGLTGDKSAVDLLRDRVHLDLPRDAAVTKALVHLQFAEAIVRLGETSYLGPVRAAVYSPFPEVRVLAVSMVSDLGDRTQTNGLANLLFNDDVETMELRVAAANALAHFGDKRGASVIFEGAHAEDPRVRAFAARGLAALRDPEAGQALVGLLLDPDEQVRLASAAAILSAAAPLPKPKAP
jgi:HEAT repeat protein